MASVQVLPNFAASSRKQGHLEAGKKKDLELTKNSCTKMSSILGKFGVMLCYCLISVLSFGPMPNHIAFIMNGNCRFAKKQIGQGTTCHRAGFFALISVLRYCYEMGVKYVTVYAFSIDNFKRKPEEVQSTMDLIKEKIDKLLQEQIIVNKYGIRINFWGNLNLLNDAVRHTVEKVMRNTCDNTGLVLFVCVAYTSTDEIIHAIENSCSEKVDRMQMMHKSDFVGELDT